MRHNYAERLTKEDLIKNGYTLTLDARVFRYGVEYTPYEKGNYLDISLYWLDEDDKPIKLPIIKKGKETYTYAQRSVGLHRAMWAYFVGEVPDGMVVDHKDNTLNKQLRENNTLDKLQLMTQGENLAKDRVCTAEANPDVKGWPSRDFIVDRINYYKELNEQAKEAHDAEAAHRWRSSISQWKAKLRLFDSDPERYTKAPKERKRNEACHLHAARLRFLKHMVKVWHDIYRDTRLPGARDEWKKAIAAYKDAKDD